MTARMIGCPDWGPDGSHDYRDEDTKIWIGVCSCGHRDDTASVVQRFHSRSAAAMPADPPF